MLSHSYRLRCRSRHFLSLPLNVDRITHQTTYGLALVRRKTGKNAARKRIKTDSVKKLVTIRSDKGRRLETTAFQSLYGGQFILSTPLINQIFVYYHTGFLGNLIFAKRFIL